MTYGDARPSCFSGRCRFCQVGVQVVARGRQRVVGGHADPAQRLHRIGEQIARVGEMLDQRREFGQHLIQRVVALRHDRQQPVGGIDGAGDVLGLLVQLVGERVELVQELRIWSARPFSTLKISV